MGELVEFPQGRRAQGPGRRYLTKREIAEYLGVSCRTVERYHAMGLPVYKLRGRNLYRPSEVDGWLSDLRT